MFLSVFLCLLSLVSSSHYLYDRPICTGLGDRVGTMLSLAALARVENATIAYLWCNNEDGLHYGLAEFRARFHPPSEIVFVDDLLNPAIQRLPKVVSTSMPFPSKQGSDMIPQNAWLTMRLPTTRKLNYIDTFQHHYRSVAAPMAMTQPCEILHGQYFLLHMRGPDETNAGRIDHPAHYCTGKVVKALLGLKLDIPIYAISNNLDWAGELLEGRVRFINDTGSAYDHFSLLISAKAIIQHAWGGWSSYSSVPALISGAPMMNTYDPTLAHHRFRVFRSQLGVPSNYYDCTQAHEFIQAIQSRLPQPAPPPSHGINPAELLYTPEGHQHLLSSRLNERGLAPLTRWTQNFIYQNQFVQDCSSRRFIGFHGWKGGFGSEMHNIGALLGYAIEHNTTLLLSRLSCPLFRCQTGCECLLSPISNCKFQEATDRMHVMNNEGHHFRYIVPSVVKAALLAHYPRMTERQVLYWWRAQSSAFVARFNDETIQAIAALRKSSPGIPFPLPPGVINAHIRGGDKHWEMQLVFAGRYVEAAINMTTSMPHAFGHSTLLITADDEDAVQDAVHLGRSRGFEVLYSSITRLPGGYDQGEWMKRDDQKQRLHEHLLQLTLALEADAWIGTRASNWNRLIDELRCVWVDKCLHPYVEVGGEFLGSYSW
jgi:hypothetical protein